MESVEILSTLLQLADGVGTVILGIYMISLYTSGKILPKIVADSMLASERSGEDKTSNLQDEHLKTISTLYEKVISEKDQRIIELEKSVKEKEKLAELGLQFVMSSQRLQDRSAGLLSKVSELVPMGMIGTDFSGEE